MINLPKHIRSQTLRKATKKTVAITTIHDPDAIWIDQLLSEYSRLGWEVAWHFNNLSDTHCKRLANYKGTIGFSWALPGGPPYTDYDYSYPLDIAQNSGAEWVCVHNPDETMEPNAPQMLDEMFKKRVLYIARWYNIWEIKPDGTLMIATDSPFLGHKSKFYPIGPWKCEFRGGVSSMYYQSAHIHPFKMNELSEPPAEWSDIRILHWGFSTRELRARHHVQWKGTKLTGKVHSDYWDVLIDRDNSGKVNLKPFDPSQTHEQFVTSS